MSPGMKDPWPKQGSVTCLGGVKADHKKTVSGMPTPQKASKETSNDDAYFFLPQHNVLEGQTFTFLTTWRR